MLPTTRVNCHLFDFIGNGAVGKKLLVTLTRSKIANNTTEPSRDSTFDRWWEPVSRASEWQP